MRGGSAINGGGGLCTQYHRERTAALNCFTNVAALQCHHFEAVDITSTRDSGVLAVFRKRQVSDVENFILFDKCEFSCRRDWVADHRSVARQRNAAFCRFFLVKADKTPNGRSRAGNSNSSSDSNTQTFTTRLYKLSTDDRIVSVSNAF